jgi:hypothetical protein
VTNRFGHRKARVNQWEIPSERGEFDEELRSIECFSWKVGRARRHLVRKKTLMVDQTKSWTQNCHSIPR